VIVEARGNQTIIRFEGVIAFDDLNHQTTTTLGAFLICSP